MFKVFVLLLATASATLADQPRTYKDLFTPLREFPDYHKALEHLYYRHERSLLYLRYNRNLLKYPERRELKKWVDKLDWRIWQVENGVRRIGGRLDPYMEQDMRFKARIEMAPARPAVPRIVYVYPGCWVY